MKPDVFDLFAVTASTEEELFQTLLTGRGPFRLERIVSFGQSSAKDFWYDQEDDEWVALLSGRATLLFLQDDGSTETVSLRSGQALFIPAHCRHRLLFTSTTPPCLWLALHGTLENQ